ncbi:helix-turn-helix domain-containing protein [Streptomyces sp. NPDC047108]|uniref:helix-turn-helix domain-containing protein n=1 Tax=Streptomyces sp. NPDC047108 TaxID=3155025 RepID=UPI0033F13E0C
MSVDQVDRYAELRAKGVPHDEIAERFGVDPARLHEAIGRYREAGLVPHPLWSRAGAAVSDGSGSLRPPKP